MKGHQLNRPVLTISNPSPFLRDRIREDSNYELDWLWSAKQVSVIEEIRYCLERAFYINPSNHETQQMLAKLSLHTANSETQQIERSSRAQLSNV